MKKLTLLVFLLSMTTIVFGQDFTENTKIITTSVVFLFNFIGSILYWWFGKDKSQNI